MDNFQKFVYTSLRQKKKSKKLYEDKTLFIPIDNDSVFTLHIALKNKLVDRDQALIDAIKVTIDEDPSAIEYVALALKHGADPNVYVLNETNNIKYHILYYIFDLMEGNTQNNRLFQLLVIAGSDPNKDTIDAKHYSKNVGSISSLYLQEPRLRNTVIENIEDEEELRKLYVSNIIMTYYSNKKYIEDIDPDVAFDIIMLLDKTDFITKNMMNDGDLLDNCIGMHSNKAVKLLMSEEMAKRRGQELLEICIMSYNKSALKQVLRKGAIPYYVHIDAMILGSMDRARNNLPLSSARLNLMIAIMVEHGYDLDPKQLSSISTFSPETYNTIMKIYEEVPYWQRTCQVPVTDPTDELKRVAKNLNIDPGSSKATICRKINKIKDSDPNKLNALNKRIQSKKIELESGPDAQEKKSILINLANITRTHRAPIVNSGKRIQRTGTGRLTMYLSKPRDEMFVDKEKLRDNLVCVNRDTMTVDPSSVADIDITYYNDGDSTYCFTSEEYRDLILSGKNPYTDEELPSATVNEMEMKFKTLQEEGFDTTKRPESYQDGLKSVHLGETREEILERTRELSMNNIKKMFDYANETKNEDVETFLETANADEINQVAQGYFGKSLPLDSQSADHALAGFADAIIYEIDVVGADKQEVMDYISNTIQNLYG